MFITSDHIQLGSYDCIIVGSGPAGSVLGRKLAEAGRSVLLFESGGTEFDAELQESLNVIAASGHLPSEHWPFHWIRALGGTSGIWAGWCMPLDDRDFRDWPVQRSELESFYRAAYEEHLRDAGFLEYRDRFNADFQYKPFSIGEIVRYGENYLDFFRDNKNIDVLTGCSVVRLFQTADRDRVTGLEIFEHRSQQTSTLQIKAQTQVVLCAGGLGNPQIMLASRDGSEPAVGNARDQVGRYLCDHPHVNDCAMLLLSPEAPLRAPSIFMGNHVDAIQPDDSLYDEIGRYAVSLSLTALSEVPQDDFTQHLLTRLGRNTRAFSVTARFEMKPDPGNRVDLAPEATASGLPALRIRCVIENRAFMALETCLTRLGQRMAHENTGRVWMDEAAIFRDFYGGGHYMCTTRMGVSPETSVVDRDCRVHGYTNLYIAGSSVFTTGGCANPTLTITALSMRLAAHLEATL